jgi:hypothetical protein
MGIFEIEVFSVLAIWLIIKAGSRNTRDASARLVAQCCPKAFSLTPSQASFTRGVREATPPR